MRFIDRLQQYLSLHDITAYAFEHTCRLSNGYLGKQLRGKGAVGSDIIARIKEHYPELSLVWLLTGKGRMLLSSYPITTGTGSVDLNEEQQVYFTSKDEVITVLNKQVTKLEAIIADKDKIISLLEWQLKEASVMMR